MSSKIPRKSIVPPLNFKWLNSVQAKDSQKYYYPKAQASLHPDSLQELSTDESLNGELANSPQYSIAEISPGKLKTTSDKMASLITKTREILCVYGLELVYSEYHSSRREIYNFLDALLQEICLFPQDFFRGVGIKQLVICREELHGDLCHPSNFFSLNDLDTRQKVSKKLHKLILDQMNTINSQLLDAWDTYKSVCPLDSTH